MSKPFTILATCMSALTLTFFGPGVASADHDGSGFFNIILLSNIHDDPADKLQDPRLVAEFNYVRELQTPGLDAPAGWTDGDRKAYSCAYGFLVYRGWIVGRVTYSYIDPPGDGNQPRIVDRSMHEGIRHWATGALDGNPEPEQMEPATSCPGPAGTSDQFPTLAGMPNEAPPSVTFQHGPHVIEVRDFVGGEGFGLGGPDVQRLDAGSTFRLGLVTEARAEIIAYQAGVPVLQILYELMAPGWVVPGTNDPVTLHVARGAAYNLQGLKAKVKGDRATIRGSIQPPASGQNVKLTFLANGGSALRKVAAKSATLDTSSGFRKRFKVPSDSTGCKVVVRFNGAKVGQKRFRC
jgi:hypothetical protein